MLENKKINKLATKKNKSTKMEADFLFFVIFILTIHITDDNSAIVFPQI